jgi:hypothetical protein
VGSQTLGPIITDFCTSSPHCTVLLYTDHSAAIWARRRTRDAMYFPFRSYTPTIAPRYGCAAVLVTLCIFPFFILVIKSFSFYPFLFSIFYFSEIIIKILVIYFILFYVMLFVLFKNNYYLKTSTFVFKSMNLV